MDKKVLWEAVKEPLRLLVLAIIPVVSVYLEVLTVEWATVLLVVLRFVDKYLHELGKEEKNDNLTKGITRF
jgi:hypothetical protein